MKKFNASVNALRDLSLQELEINKKHLPPEVYKKCHYVVSENERLLKGCDMLREGDLQSFGKLMYETHEGLSKEYGVSCAELDFMVDTAKKQNGIAGARMMGGGFGGCTINLVKTHDVPAFEKAISQAYQESFEKDPEIYVTQIEEGARRIPSIQ